MSVLADSGALYALADRDDVWHERVRDWWAANPEPVLVAAAALPEAAYLMGSRLGARAEAAFARAVAGGDFLVEPLAPEDYPRVADLVEGYLDLPLGFVDASIVATAERLGITTLLTTDRRHFGVVRPAHVPRLLLVP